MPHVYECSAHATTDAAGRVTGEIRSSTLDGRVAHAEVEP